MSASDVELVTTEGDIYAKLIVPTQSSGASISQNSAQIRGDTFAVGQSTGNVHEEPYEDYITELVVSSEQVEIGLLLQTESNTGRLKKMQAKEGQSPDRTLRIPVSEVTDVRQDKVEAFPGLVFETADDVYQIKFATTGGGRVNFTNRPAAVDTKPIADAVELIQQNMGGPSPGKAETATDGNSASIADELERLADLHERGVLSDEELETAKQELLE